MAKNNPNVVVCEVCEDLVKESNASWEEGHVICDTCHNNAIVVLTKQVK